MEDFIYVIILVAWVAFAIYRQSQKKKAAKKPHPTPSQANSPGEPTFKSLEDILFGKETTVPEPAESQEILEPEMSLEMDYEEPLSLEETYMRRLNEEAEKQEVQDQQVAEKIVEKEVLKEEEDTSLQKSNPLDDFDLRKAVIFSEILRRPYD